MTRSFRILLAAFVAAFAIAGASSATAGSVTLSDPNCDSFTLNGAPGSQTLSCVVSNPPVCTVVGPSAGSINNPITLTAQCSPAATSWVWTGGNCNAQTAQQCPAVESSPGIVPYTVRGSNANGPGATSIALSVTWSSGPPPAPTGCVASISTNPSPLANAGGTATVSVTGCSPSGVTYSWSKNGAPGWSTSASPAADTLGSGGTAGYTNSYQVTVCNGSTCINVPASNPLTAFVPGTGGGGGSNIDMAACTAAGYAGHGVDIAYPIAQNSPRVFTTSAGNFGSNDMIVVRFVAPASETTPGATITASEYSVYPAVQRLATLATQPCVVAPSGGAIPGLGVLASASNFPVANLSMAVTSVFGKVKLTPGATYYVNYVNRVGYTTEDSCGAGNCAMYIDFKN